MLFPSILLVMAGLWWSIVVGCSIVAHTWREIESYARRKEPFYCSQGYNTVVAHISDWVFFYFTRKIIEAQVVEHKATFFLGYCFPAQKSRGAASSVPGKHVVWAGAGFSLVSREHFPTTQKYSEKSPQENHERWYLLSSLVMISGFN